MCSSKGNTGTEADRTREKRVPQCEARKLGREGGDGKWILKVLSHGDKVEGKYIRDRLWMYGPAIQGPERRRSRLAEVSALTLLLLNKRPLLPVVFLLPWALQMM